MENELENCNYNMPFERTKFTVVQTNVPPLHELFVPETPFYLQDPRFFNPVPEPIFSDKIADTQDRPT